MPAPSVARSLAGAQKFVVGGLETKAGFRVCFLAGLHAPPVGEDALGQLVPVGLKEGAGGQVRMEADRFDLLEYSSMVDPSKYLPPAVNQLLGSPATLFPDPPSDLDSFPGIRDRDCGEYSHLIAKQLLSGRVELTTSVCGGGTVFSVSCKVSANEIWHGLMSQRRQ